MTVKKSGWQRFFRFSLVRLFFCFSCISTSSILAYENPKEEGYTINFDNVNVKEFVRFISKVGKLNFIYDEAELNFNITIVSEEETPLSNILSALVQVLRIHNLSLIEEGQNLLIHTNSTIKQIPSISSDTHPLHPDDQPVLLTKIFQLHNRNAEQVAALITPMLSNNALVEVSSATRQLIITDTYTSIENVAILIESIDTVGPPFSIKTYEVHHLPVVSLVAMATDIIKFLSGETPVLLLPQPGNEPLIFVVSTPKLVEKTLQILQELDQQASAAALKNLGDSNTLNYVLKHGNPKELIQTLEEFIAQAHGEGFDAETLHKALENARYIPQTHSMMFIAPKGTLAIIQHFLDIIDQSVHYQSNLADTSFYLFSGEGRIPIKEMHLLLKEVSEHFVAAGTPNPMLLAAIRSAKELPQIDAILFTANRRTLQELQDLLTSILDSYQKESEAFGPVNFLVYQIVNTSEKTLRHALEQFADSLESNDYEDELFIQTLDSMHWIPTTNVLVFTGHQKYLDKIRVLLATFDASPEGGKPQEGIKSQFISYHPTNVSPDAMAEALHTLATNLEEAQLAAPDLLASLKSARAVNSSGQVIVTGTPDTLQRVHTILISIDEKHPVAANDLTFTIPIQYARKKTIEQTLEQFAKSLPPSDPIVTMIKSMHWLPDAQILVFQGPQQAMDKIQEVIDRIDTPVTPTEPLNFAVVKIEHGEGKIIIEELKKTATQLSTRHDAPPSLIHTLETATWNPEANTILLIGVPPDLERAKELITTYDIPDRHPVMGLESQVYKLQYISPEEARMLLLGIVDHTTALENNQFSKQLTQAVRSLRPIPNTNAVQFVGTPQVNKKIEEWLQVLDTPENAQAKIKHAQGSSFFIYKVEHTTPKELLEHLRFIAKDLQATSTKFPETHDPSTDRAVVQVIENARIIPSSNSIVFTGPTAALEKIRSMLGYLDVNENHKVSEPPRQSPAGYQLYTPKNVPGPELIQYLKQFEQQLLASGIKEEDLAETIDHLSYLPQTRTIIVSGSDRGIKKVLSLLERFDIEEYPGSSDIALVDDLAFLNYKLQFHSGADIISALRAIGSDLRSEQLQKIEPLVDAIQSLQWIEVTNSLIASGQPKSLDKLRELIDSIDQPLKQIFIEVLVLETNIDSLLDFGLRWTSQGKFKDKFSWSTSNNPPSDPFASFTSNVTQINGSRTPTGSDLPTASGGTLGVIGDIITHKGKAYAALGSMLNAVKTDGDITIVLNQKILTQDNRNSKIFVGDNIPFTGSVVTTAGLSQTTNANLEYRNIGVTLSITPYVGRDDIVTLDISQELSEEDNSGTDTVQTQTVNGIRTSRTSMETRVHVPDRHFLILSGMIRNTVTRKKSGIPCLGGLPLIGAAFSEVQKVIDKKNIVIFVKPHIIRSPATQDEITAQQEELFGSPDQCNPEDFQNGIELVRSANDEDYED